MRSTTLFALLAFVAVTSASRTPHIVPLLTLPTPSVAPLTSGFFRGVSLDAPEAHSGIDYRAAEGTSILAAADGWAIASCEPPLVSEGGQSFGNFVLIHHDDRTHSTLYAHLESVLLSATSMLPCIATRETESERQSAARHRIIDSSRDIVYSGVTYKWARVIRGEVIGRSGKTGTKDPHLHFEASTNRSGGYQAHRSGRVDPYAIDGFLAAYPPPESNCENEKPHLVRLWTDCPPVTSTASPPPPPNQPPIAGFTMAGPGVSATEGLTLNLSVLPGQLARVTFTANRSSDDDGTVVAWAWGGTVNAIAREFTWSFGIGTHMVSLIVTDNNGARSSAAVGTVVVTSLGIPGSCGSAGAPLTFHFAGRVTSDSQALGPFPALAAGAPISGSYTFCSGSPDTDSDPRVGIYFSPAPSGMTLHAGGVTVSSNRGLRIRVRDNIGGVEDDYDVQPSPQPAGVELRLFLRTRILSTFASDALPRDPPSMSRFDGVFEVADRSGNSMTFVVDHLSR